MELIKHLFRSAVSMVLSIILIGGGTAISIVSVARGSGENLGLAATGSLALVLFGGYLMLLATPFRANIRMSGSLGKVSFEFTKPAYRRLEEAEEASEQAPMPEEVSLVARVFCVLALVCVSIICIGGGIATIIVATVRHEGTTLPYAMIFTGVIQTIFGGYLSTIALNSKPWIKASGDFKEGISLELKK